MAGVRVGLNVFRSHGRRYIRRRIALERWCKHKHPGNLEKPPQHHETAGRTGCRANTEQMATQPLRGLDPLCLHPESRDLRFSSAVLVRGRGLGLFRLGGAYRGAFDWRGMQACAGETEMHDVKMRYSVDVFVSVGCVQCCDGVCSPRLPETVDCKTFFFSRGLAGIRFLFRLSQRANGLHVSLAKA